MWLTFHGYRRSLLRDRRVLQGPVAGLRFGEDIPLPPLRAKILGTYERELADVIGAIPEGEYQRVVDVGAAEGYYAVGLARANPDMPIVAFEGNPETAAVLARTKALNGVGDRLTLLGNCDLAALAGAVVGRTFVLMDVEGAEVDLLDPKEVPGLAKADILVEVHDFAGRNIGDTLTRRFQESHVIREIWQAPRDATQLPDPPSRAQPEWWHWTLQRPHRRIHRMLDEGRVERMRWLWMRARS